MDIIIYGKKISITDKNARAYEKLNLIPASADCVVCYYTATYHESNEKVLNRIHECSDREISDFVNKCVEQEVRDCGGVKFYKEA